MKKVLITGANSYIGTSFEKWIWYNGSEIQVDTINMVGSDWKDKDFSQYDSIFHVAGIAHADIGHVSKERQGMYYRINCDLAVETALKAKNEGVKQFIYMSSIIVYGESAGVRKKRVITVDTPTSPSNFYGDSKVQAELKLQELNDKNFKIVILRPPMIYGKGSKGNYPLLAKMAKKLPLFPEIPNERSMLYIDNLCVFIVLMILNEEVGIFFPQNKEYVSTCQMVKAVSDVCGKKIFFTRYFNWLLIIMSKLPGKVGSLVNKAFGNIVYDKKMSCYHENYWVSDFETSIKQTEK